MESIEKLWYYLTKDVFKKNDTDDIQNAPKKTKNRTSPTPDGITSERIQYGRTFLRLRL